jgi:5-methylcytosine-specific restriction endonuclease McrA
MTSVLVLNAGYEPLHRVSVQHAIRMLVREVAVVEEANGDETLGPFPMPKVLRLVRYVQMKWRGRKAPGWSRSRLFARDGHRCAYCGKRVENLTVDHIIPRAKGGLTTWENTVAACGGSKGCNARKGSRTLEESGLTLRVVPRVPSAWDFA